MLKLRRGVVVEIDPLTVEVGDERRPAWADPGLIGAPAVGDEVLVNTEAVDLGLGSGGFDIVCANLTTGLEGEGADGDVHVIKLNYSPLQHPVDPIELGHDDAPPRPVRRPPVLVLPLHGHLAPAAWALDAASGGLAAGYVQTPGAALPGALSRDVRALRERGLLAGHMTAGPCYGGESEAISVVGALHAAAERMGWDVVIAGPGPGILGSATRYGHGGMAALEVAHASLSLGLPTLLSPRLSGADPRRRHRGLSHHTASVLELILQPVRLPVPEADLEGWPTGVTGMPDALAAISEACGERHDIAVEQVDLAGYAKSGLPTKTMGRSIEEDPLFFAAPLAAGRSLARAARAGA